MRVRTAGVVLFVAMAMPKVGMAQVYGFRTQPPQVTAASAPWQIGSEPIVLDGLVYQPTAFARPFDGGVMMQIGVYDNVPIYADATLEPFSVVYVPVARGAMRQYERVREGAIAGTQGSRAPAFPVQPVSGLPAATTGTLSGGSTPLVSSTASAPGTVVTVITPTHVESIPRPRSTDGVWIRYEGSKWYSHGEAALYSPERFVRIGTYRGFPVYRERRDGRKDEIWVAVVEDGPVAPYSKR